MAKQNIYVATSSYDGSLMFRVGKKPYSLRKNESVEFKATEAEFKKMRYPKQLAISLKSASDLKEEENEIVEPKVEEVKVEEVIEIVEEPKAEEVVEEVVVEEPVAEEPVVEAEPEPKKPARRGRRKKSESVKIETDENN